MNRYLFALLLGVVSFGSNASANYLLGCEAKSTKYPMTDAKYVACNTGSAPNDIISTRMHVSCWNSAGINGWTHNDHFHDYPIGVGFQRFSNSCRFFADTWSHAQIYVNLRNGQTYKLGTTHNQQFVFVVRELKSDGSPCWHINRHSGCGNLVN